MLNQNITPEPAVQGTGIALITQLQTKSQILLHKATTDSISQEAAPDLKTLKVYFVYFILSHFPLLSHSACSFPVPQGEGKQAREDRDLLFSYPLLSFGPNSTIAPQKSEVTES